MIRKIRTICVVVMGLCLMACGYIQAQEASDKRLLLRQAQEDTKAIVGMEAYLIDDMLEVEVAVGMQGSRPSIKNIIFLGTNIGILVPKTVEQVYAKSEEDQPYETIKHGGFLSSVETKKKQLYGSITRKKAVFKLPVDKIVSGGLYEIKVEVATVKQVAGAEAKETRFIFTLEGLPKLISNSGA